MQKFSLDIWLQDKSRKVVTRDGREVEILKVNAKGNYPIIGVYPFSDTEDMESSWRIDGRKIENGESFFDLFFADEEKEYTEFEKELRYWIGQSLCNYENNGCVSDNMSDSVNKYLKTASKKLLDLAKKELQPEFDKEMDKMLAETDKVVYQKGKQDALKELEHCVTIPEDCYYEQLASQYHKGHKDALKSLPKWKKVDSNPAKFQYNLQGTRLYKDGEYYIELSDLETLPKEE